MAGNYQWLHKDLLDVTQLSKGDLGYLLNSALQYKKLNNADVKKADDLRGKTVMLFFAEDSTRTRTSFDVAAKRLSADVFALNVRASSINKGESLKDTGLTLEAMNPDIIVMRHSSSGAAQYLARRLKCSVVNGGDGWHAHPTQALLDFVSLAETWGNLDNFAGKELLILGDIAHSRVARSNVHLMRSLGAKVRLCAPRTLLPAGVETWPVTVYTDLGEACQGADAIMALRIQLERQQAGLFPDLHEYACRYCLTPSHLQLASKNVKVLHPGPMNRGLEISDDVADAPECLVLDQVANGVALRMAVLNALANRIR